MLLIFIANPYRTWVKLFGIHVHFISLGLIANAEQRKHLMEYIVWFFNHLGKSVLLNSQWIITD